jgi:outer membrane beta-barrel protein
MLVAMLGLAVALVAPTGALAKPNTSNKAPAGKGSGASKGSGGDAGDIDMDAQPSGNTAPASGSGADIDIDMDSGSGSGNDLAADLAASDAQAAAPVKEGPIKKTPLSWKDITVVIRKPFLKVRRTELYPFIGLTMNDNIIRHFSQGGELNYFLTDVLAIGVEGQYYEHSTEDAFDLVARQARRLPTVNQYNWSAALDFHYVPVYGKFAVLDHKLITWEAYFTAGIGVGQSEVIPRDPEFPGFTNLLIQPNIGVNMRFFLAKWLTVNFGIRDYAFEDKFEPTNRAVGMNDTAAEASAHADGAFINNIMFQIGLAFWVPTSFEYTTFR